MGYPLTLTPILERAGRLFGKVEVVSRRPDRSLHRTSYAQIYRRARALAAALDHAGLRRGERVATLMWNHAVHLEAYFGIPVAGGVLHTLNLRLHPGDLAFIANHAEDRFLIVDDNLLPLYEKFRGEVRFERVFVVPQCGQPLPQGCESYEEFVAGGLERAAAFRYPELDENDAAAMCYTSGTTGAPKGVLYSHRAIVLHSLAEATVDILAVSQRDTVLAVVPMFHANAWGLPFACTMAGCKQVLPGPHLDAESLLDLLESERVTLAAGVPTVWMGILAALEKEPQRWQCGSMRMLVGGSAVPEAMLRAFDRHGMRIVQGWGMTEMSPLGTTSWLKSYLEDLPEEERYRLRAMQGLPAPFVEVRAMAEDGETPWDGRSMGELQVRGPWIAAQYHNLETECDRWTGDGWLRTGDVVTIEPEGYVKIADRTKDLIKSGGEWISSVDLENMLMGHPAVKEAAVIALPHPKWDERPLAVVVLKEGAAASAEDLKAWLEAKFTRWQLPDAFVFADQIPRTSVGKFQKMRLRELYQDWKW